jgi:hypothetical protein
MGSFVTGAAWTELLITFEHSAWRYECQGEYHEPYEAEPFRKFLAGEPDDLQWMASWLRGVRDNTASGKSVGRVRVLTEPLTDYLRWEMELAYVNVAAGEDIRVLAPADAARLKLGSDDFWLLDDRRAAVMRFGGSGFEDAMLYDHDSEGDAEMIRRCREIRDLALRHARPFAEHLDLRRDSPR